MKRRPIRVYADTSVFGGVFDKEFMNPSRMFFDQVKSGKFRLVTSAVVEKEIALGPLNVQSLFLEQIKTAEKCPVSDEGIALRNAYIKAGIVDVKSIDDALHVALATISGCGLIVSWNFKHIVNFQKIPLYNSVNGKRGYHAISIYSPLEVIESEE